jgi:hypothetical protein
MGHAIVNGGPAGHLGCPIGNDGVSHHPVARRQRLCLVKRQLGIIIYLFVFTRLIFKRKGRPGISFHSSFLLFIHGLFDTWPIPFSLST